MRPILAASAAALACACAPAPMAASEAGEHLARFAAGTTETDVCSPEGRALLRSAVRGYGAELARAGVAWPAVPGASEAAPNSVDIAVLVAFATGFVEASDFQSASRRMVRQSSFAERPQIRDLRAAAQVACAQVTELQRAASRFVLELERYERMAARAGRAEPERLARQEARMQRARRQMEQVAAFVEAEIEAARAR
jgi:hypothetical protein